MYILRTAATILSIFSLAFSMSLARELKNVDQIDTMTIVLVIPFIIFALIMNEYFKVQNLSDKFNGKRYSIIVLAITFTISFSLSGIGIYFWTNKTTENRDKAMITFKDEQFHIDDFYANKIDSISSLQLKSNTYQVYLKDLEYWKNRTCYSEKQREQARANVLQTQENIKELEAAYQLKLVNQIERINKRKDAQLASVAAKYASSETKNNKNTFLFYIYFALVAFAEGMIVYVQFRIAKFFDADQRLRLKILNSILQKNYENITLSDVRYHVFLNPDKKNDLSIKEKAKNFRYLLGDLGIIHKDPEEKGLILMNKKKAYKTLKSYYIQINTL